MIKIAHRGNTDGRKENFENSPEYLQRAIYLGFDVECDVWAINNKIYFGHDKPFYKVDEYFINKIANDAWFHCKNIEALYLFSSKYKDTRYFWHQEDDYTLTSNGYIWTYPGKDITDKSIVVCLEKTNQDKYLGAYGLCSDYLI